jgi:predicted nucleotide-binding protein (sugar kinase/HSP70/actin superfamily)
MSRKESVKKISRCLIFALMIAIIYGASIFHVYSETKESYHAVGFNDGSISERILLMEKIRQTKTVHECHELENDHVLEAFLSVKAEEPIYLAFSPKGDFLFCQYNE